MNRYVHISRRMFLRAACTASLLAVVPSFAQHAHADEIGQSETAALAAAQREYDEAQERLQTIGTQLETTQLAIETTERELVVLQSDIVETQDAIVVTTDELEAAQDALAAYLQISYKTGSLTMLDVIFGATDFNDYITRSYYATAIQNSQVETINEIKELKTSLEELEIALSNQEEEEAILLDQLEEEQNTLSAEKDEADTIVANLSDEVQELFAAQQAELQAVAEARARAATAAEGAAESLGVYAPNVSQGSVVENAYACLGIPYVWAGDDDNFAEVGGFDCSGFVQHCYALEGYTIGRTTWDQIDDVYAHGNWHDSIDELEPGDLAFPSETHVGIYIGNGQMIDAPYPGMYIRIDTLTDFIGGGSPV